MSSTTTTSNWVKTITSPFRKAKACTFFNPNPNQAGSTNKKTHHRQHHHAAAGGGGGGIDQNGVIMDLHGEVMACGYEDVQVMWSILDRNKSAHITSNTNNNVVMIAASATHDDVDDDHYSWRT